jgi:hypothetical protein
VRRQANQAERRCPDDPTAGWILTQFESQRAVLPELSPAYAADRLQRAAQVATALTSDFPGSADAWAARADVHVRAGMVLADAAPFESRHEYRLAAAAYERAGLLGDPRAALAGGAKALLALGETEAAMKSGQTLLGSAEHLGPALGLLTATYEERKDFAGAVG